MLLLSRFPAAGFNECAVSMTESAAGFVTVIVGWSVFIVMSKASEFVVEATYAELVVVTVVVSMTKLKCSFVLKS